MDRHRQSPITVNNEQLFRKAVEQEVARYPGGSILDIGAGDGSELARLKQLFTYSEATVLDHDLTCVRLAQEKGLLAIQSDLNNVWELESNRYDIVLANQVIEHLVKTDLFIKEIKRVLKPGAKAIVCTPNLASWHNIAALVLGWQPFSSQVSDEFFLGNPIHPNYLEVIDEKQAHLRLFTIRSLVELGTQHGLQVVQAKGVGFYPFSGKVAEICASIDRWHSAYVLVTFTK